jgi:chemotaxis protein CheC
MTNGIEVNSGLCNSERNSQKPFEAYTWTASKCMNLGILLELGSIGVGHAATSLAQILREPIQVDVPKIRTLPVHLVPSFYEKHDSPATGVYIQLIGESECDILLLFDVEEARKIAALMTMSESPETVDPSLEISAIVELSNILIGAFLSAISDFIGVKLEMTTPQYALDSFDAIIDNFLVKQSISSDVAIIFDTDFKRSGERASCILMMFPNLEMQNTLIAKAKKWLGNGSSKTDETKTIRDANKSMMLVKAAKGEDNQCSQRDDHE